ncbi:hypothetical protein Gogos_002169 [Gossypium gossypioides]|uniref:DUF4283 domain-containing protein n=1 Tax=Gossypium gossypioides TaxID=34282 RepID=A0A7J9CQL0_GOSGO|nr:hypothetical protein [Gossypium gossypioides]
MNSNPLNNSLENKWEEDDIDLLDGDIRNEVIDGVPYIDFSDRVYSTIEENMSKLLMDIKNDYFLAKFESYLDYSNFLSNGPWVIYGKYMMVQPWTNQFSPLKLFPHSVVAWVHILGLSRSLYKRSIFQAIDEMVGNVSKIDLKKYKGARGQFARFAVQVDLRKPLVSRIRIASRIYKVEILDKAKGTLMDWRVKKRTIFLDLGSIFFPKLEFHKLIATRMARGQESIIESIIKVTNGRKLDAGIKRKVSKGKGHKKWVVGVKGQGTKQTINEPKVEKLGGGNEEIGPKVGKREVTTHLALRLGNGDNFGGLDGMVPVQQVIQGMVDHLKVEGRAAGAREESIDLVVLESADSG